MSILLSPDAILLDLDGVLVDSRLPIARSINHALVRSGLAAVAEARLHGLIGDALHAIFALLLREQGADPGGAAACMELYRELYVDVSLSDTSLVPGIAPALERLARGRRLALATSKPLEFAGPILERLGIARHFSALAGSPLAHTEGEPKTETGRRALAALGLAPGAAAAFVGDRHHDVSAARALGLTPVGVTWGIGSEAELRAAGACHVVHTPAELQALLG